MRSFAWRLRAAALVSGGVLAVHQLRYLIGYGHQSHDALQMQGHAYLAFFVPAVVVALTLCAASLVGALVRAEPRAPTPERPDWRRLWAVSAAVLLLFYVMQEGLEGVFQSGHPGGLGSVVGHGGWMAIPLAALVGLVIAVLLGGAAAAVRRVARLVARRLGRAAPEPARPGHHQPTPSLDLFARFLVGRGPPLSLS